VRPVRPGGFTLIEVVLAMAILAVILVLVASVLVQSLETHEFLRTHGADQRLADALTDRIGADVRDAFLPGADDPPRFLASRVEGSPATIRLDLVTLADGQTDDKGREADYCEAGYRVTTEDGARWKLYRREQALVDANPTQGGEYLLLTESLGAFSLQYSDDGMAWTDAYDSKDKKRLPWAVRLSFTLLPAEGQDGEGGTGTSYDRTFFLNRYGTSAPVN